MDRDAKPRTSTLALTLRVALAAGLATIVLFAGLAWQMLAGTDPALQAAEASKPQPTSGTVALSVDGGSTGSAAPSAAPQAAPAPLVAAPAPVTSSTS